MICPSCQSSHHLKEGMTCSCGYQFKLQKARDGLSDQAFAKLVQATSGDNTYYFTENQLESRYLRRIHSKRPSPIWPLLWIAGTIGLAWAGAYFFAAIAGTVAVFSMGRALMGRTGLGPSFGSSPIPTAVARFKDDPKTLANLLTAPSLGQPPPDFVEADIYAYGTERILIVESDLMVDLFVRNDFHAHERVLILAESGYPSYLTGIANSIIEQHPHTPVFLLHHASFTGTSMLDRIKASGVLPALQNRSPDSILDLGFTQTDAKRLFAALDAALTDHCSIDSLPYPALANLVSLGMSQRTPFSALPVSEVKRFDDSGTFG